MHRPVPITPGPTIADGIAIGTPGQVPLEIMSRLGVEVRTVSEGDMAHALLALIERSKLIVEPSGAAGVAAVMAHPDSFEPGPIVVVLSGGNIDPLLIQRVIRRGLVAGGRFMMLQVELDDKPGSLARLMGIIANAGANVMDVRHSRMGTGLGVFDAIVALELETKGHEHCETILDAIRHEGFHLVP